MKLNDYRCPKYNREATNSHYLNKDMWWRRKEWGNPNFVSYSGDLVFEDNTNNPFNLIFKYEFP